MSSQVVEQLVMELELELNKFRTQAQEAERLQNKLKKNLGETESAGKSASNANKDVGNQIEKTGKQTDKTAVSVLALAGRLKGLFATVTSSVALERLATGIAKVNDNLYFMQQRLNTSAANIAKMGNAAAMLGGDAGSMQQAMQGLNQSIMQMVMMGDASILPFFNTLGVGIVDAHGDIREMDEIMLDMAESFSKMDPRQAYALASSMGLDDGVANALIQGRDAMREMLEMQNTLYISTQQELQASRELRKNQALLSAQWQSVKIMLGNAIIPLVTKLTKAAQGFVEYLLKNEKATKNVFDGLAYVVGVVATLAFGKAALAVLGLLGPIGLTALAVAALGASFIALKNDYEVWAKGGKSLFDWTRFQEFIDAGGFSVKGLSFAFKELWQDAKEAIPVLQVLANVIDKLMGGDFKGAFKELGNLPSVKSISGDTDETIMDDLRRADDKIRGWMGGEQRSQDGMTDEELKMHFRDGLRAEDERQGLPAGTMESIWMQETGGNVDYLRNPEKYHYEKNADGQRIAGHTGQVSTATGPMGILRSTGADPGWGIKPIQNWADLSEHIRMAGDYVSARGLAAYGEGTGYANQVAARRDSIQAGMGFSRGTSTITAPKNATVNTSGRTDISMTTGDIIVNTSANHLEGVTVAGLDAAIDKSANMLNQMVPGL